MRINKRKGQVANQLFIFLTTVIVIGLMFLFGIKWVVKLLQTESDITVAQLKVELEESFKSIKSNYGSWTTEKYEVPNGVEKVCFIDRTQFNPAKHVGPCNTTGPDYDPIICDAWGDREGEENVFFRPEGVDIPIYLQGVRISNGYKCLDVTSGTIEIRLKGLGDSVQIL